MQPLTYSNYINDTAIIEALRVPQPPPAGQTADTWPTWHSPEATGPGVAWRPGEPWPSGGNWCHDEVLFIRTHQAFEVWFALMLHELDSVVEEAGAVCRSRGAELPRVSLAERHADAPPHAPREYPALARQGDACRQDELAARIRRVKAPGRHRLNTSLRLEWFRVESLAAWTGRIERCTSAMHVTIPFFDVLATLTPAQFLQFRGRLVPASGFGSVQFRELEMLAGLRELNQPKLRPPGGVGESEPGGPALPPGMWRPTTATPSGVAANAFYHAQPPSAWPRVARRYAAASLRDLAYALLNVNGLLWAYDADERAAIDVFAARNIEETVRDWQQAAVNDGGGAESLLTERIDELDLLLSHRENIVAALLAMQEPTEPRRVGLSRLLDACLRLDAALLTWRDRHIRFVEAMIGTRRGTGGGGVQYLRGTTEPSRGAYLTHAFPCLWQARSLVQKA